MTIPVTSELRGEPARANRALGTAGTVRTLWRAFRRRLRSSAEAFLGSAVPPPHMVFPDSGSPLAQFPTLSSMVMLRGRVSGPVWDEPSAVLAVRRAEQGRLRRGVGFESHRAKAPVAEPEVVPARPSPS